MAPMSPEQVAQFLGFLDSEIAKLWRERATMAEEGLFPDVPFYGKLAAGIYRNIRSEFLRTLNEPAGSAVGSASLAAGRHGTAP